MSDEPIDAMVAGAADGDRDAVIAALAEFEGVAAADRSHERRYSSLAIAIRMAGEADTAGWRAANDYLEAVQSVEAARIDLQHVGLEFGLEIVGSSALLDAVDAYRTARTARETTRDALRAARDAVGAPPLLALERPDGLEVPLGSHRTRSVECANVGGAPTGEVTILGTADLPLTVTPAAHEPIEPDETAIVEISVTGRSLGTVGVSVTAECDQTEDTVRFPVDVIGQEEYRSRARRSLEGVAEIADETDRGLARMVREIIETLADGDGDKSEGNGGNRQHRGRGGRQGDRPPLEATLTSSRNRLEGLDRRIDGSGAIPALLKAELQPRVGSAKRALDRAIEATG